tara:strand:- start:43 stop:267 length:225 start_codon:yes stop_codon:yes gene_type:complete
MATIEGVYKLLKEKQRKGENIGIFGQSYIEMFENKDNEQPTTKEVDVSFIKNKNENQDTRQPTQDQVKQEEQSK